MQGIGDRKIMKLIERLQLYTEEKNILERRLENPRVKKRETRECRLLALEKRLIPSLREKINENY